MKKRWILIAFGVLVIAPILIAGFGWAVVQLWNHLMPGIFGLPQIGFWQAVGLLILSRLLFGGRALSGGRGYRGRGMGERWRRMTPEQRKQFVAGLRGDRSSCPPASDSDAGNG